MENTDVQAAALKAAQAGTRTQAAVRNATKQVVLGTKFVGLCTGAFFKALFTKPNVTAN